MWPFGKTLESQTSVTLVGTNEDQDKTLIASIQSARSSGLMLLHSLLTLGFVHPALTEVNKRAEAKATRRIGRKTILG